MYLFFKHLIEYFAKDNMYIQPTLYNFFLNPKNEILRIKASLERKNQLLNSELEESKKNYSKEFSSELPKVYGLNSLISPGLKIINSFPPKFA